METKSTGIFQRLLNGEAVSFSDRDYYRISKACDETRKLLVRLNNEADADEIRRVVKKNNRF
jgi:hypothetical protein